MRTHFNVRIGEKRIFRFYIILHRVLVFSFFFHLNFVFERDQHPFRSIRFLVSDSKYTRRVHDTIVNFRSAHCARRGCVIFYEFLQSTSYMRINFKTFSEIRSRPKNIVIEDDDHLEGESAISM